MKKKNIEPNIEWQFFIQIVGVEGRLVLMILNNNFIYFI